MPVNSAELAIVVGLALLFKYLNGMRDASNIVATMIYSRAFHPRTALVITAIAEFIGPFLFGVVVAKTIGGGIVDSHFLTLNTLIACLVGQIVWNLTTWFFGLPSSSSHALLGGLIGSIIISAAVSSLKWGGLNTVFLGLIHSPIFGFVFGFLLLRLIYHLAQRATPAINVLFKHGQIITAVGLGLGHGTNHAQKTMGVIALSLVIGSVTDGFAVPMWVIVSTATALAAGAAIVIVGASLTGAPVSTTKYPVRPLSALVHQNNLEKSVGVLPGILYLHGLLRYRFEQYVRPPYIC